MTGIFNNLSSSAFLTKVILMSGLRHKLAKRDTRIEQYLGIKEFDICLLKSVRYRQAERGWFFHTVRNRTKVKARMNTQHSKGVWQQIHNQVSVED